MREQRLMQVLLAPHITEKSMLVADSGNQYTFKVVRNATKVEIKQAVELMFNVQVAKVSVVNIKGKTKRMGTRYGKRSDIRKAYVRLEAGQEIEFSSAVE
ncbi:50S ribosomal protein L23 [Ectothiorhodospiraceae bacterium BW-2]|nr:50S ribosomal protein L23 [Ectothiorhodospiraceae bacterium BW-2]